jgi:hypothetical protein
MLAAGDNLVGANIAAKKLDRDKAESSRVNGGKPHCDPPQRAAAA